MVDSAVSRSFGLVASLRDHPDRKSDKHGLELLDILVSFHARRFSELEAENAMLKDSSSVSSQESTKSQDDISESNIARKDISGVKEKDSKQTLVKQRITKLKTEIATLNDSLTPSIQEDADAGEQKVTPYDVNGALDAQGNVLAIDYTKLQREFGTQSITTDLLERFKQVTGCEPHTFMRRAHFHSHRYFHRTLDRHEKGLPFYIYTGRGPSSDSLHLGHMIPFQLTKYLQDVFDVPVVIQLTDDDKFLLGKGSLEQIADHTRENAKDILAVGFDIKKTFLFSSTQFKKEGDTYNTNILRVSAKVTDNQVQGTFGFTGSDSIGKHSFPAVEMASAFATTFPHIFGTDEKSVEKIPCLIPCAINQLFFIVLYYRMAYIT